MPKAIAKKITWWAAAEIIGVIDRTRRRWREGLEEQGYSGQSVGVQQKTPDLGGFKNSLAMFDSRRQEGPFGLDQLFR